MTIIQKDGSFACKFFAFEGQLMHWQDDTFVFDSSLNYPVIGDKFFFTFHFNKKNSGEVQVQSVKIAGDIIFKKT